MATSRSRHPTLLMGCVFASVGTGSSDQNLMGV